MWPLWKTGFFKKKKKSKNRATVWSSNPIPGHISRKDENSNLKIYMYPSVHACMHANSLQSCLTLCEHIDGSPPGSPVPGILQARTLEWVAISFSNAWKWKVKVNLLSHAWLLATPWTAAFQAPPSMGFSRQEYLSGVPHYLPQLRHGSNLIPPNIDKEDVVPVYNRILLSHKK